MSHSHEKPVKKAKFSGWTKKISIIDKHFQMYTGKKKIKRNLSKFTTPAFDYKVMMIYNYSQVIRFFNES